MENVQNMQVEATETTQKIPKEVRTQQVVSRLIALEAMLNTYKTLFGEKEALTLELKELVGVDVEVSSGDTIMKVVDNFAEKNTVFRPTGVRRFDLELDSATVRAERLLKAEKKELKKKAKE